MFRAEVMLRELARLEPEIRNAAKDAVDQLTSDLDFYRLAEGPFAEAPKKSIDYAVMERTALAAVLPVSFRWSISEAGTRCGTPSNGIPPAM